jgi:hypothetical protein
MGQPSYLLASAAVVLRDALHSGLRFHAAVVVACPSAVPSAWPVSVEWGAVREREGSASRRPVAPPLAPLRRAGMPPQRSPASARCSTGDAAQDQPEPRHLPSHRLLHRCKTPVSAPQRNHATSNGRMKDGPPRRGTFNRQHRQRLIRVIDGRDPGLQPNLHRKLQHSRSISRTSIRRAGLGFPISPTWAITAISIAGVPLGHRLYHFRLAFSGWSTPMLCSVVRASWGPGRGAVECAVGARPRSVGASQRQP